MVYRREARCAVSQGLVFFIFISCIFLSATLSSQTENSGHSSQGIEEKTAQQRRASLLNLLIYSADPTEKRLALQQLSKVIGSGELSPDDSVTINTIANLARQGTTFRLYDGKHNLVNDFFHVRAAACNLLGKIKGPLAEAFLLNILQNETDPLIIAIALENLAKAQPEGSPTTLATMVAVFSKFHYSNPVNSLAKSFLHVAAGYVADSGGKLLTPSLSRAIHMINLSNSGYIRAVRSQARTLLLDWVNGVYAPL